VALAGKKVELSAKLDAEEKNQENVGRRLVDTSKEIFAISTRGRIPQEKAARLAAGQSRRFSRTWSPG
jgi:hypothetical protein